VRFFGFFRFGKGKKREKTRILSKGDFCERKYEKNAFKRCTFSNKYGIIEKQK
jgi:hypothetical protein